MFLSLFQSDFPSELQTNVLAAHLVNFFKRTGQIPPLQILKNLDWKSPIEWSLPPTSVEISYLNYRFRSFLVSGIRKYGVEPNWGFYGLDLVNKSKKPHSLVLLGINGSGKSSLYAAMEKVGLGKSNLALLRGFNSRNENIFLRHGNFDDNQCKIYLETDSKQIIEIDLHTFRNALISEACFCSDYDVEQLEQKDVHSTFILKQLGAESSLEVLNLLDEYIKSIKADFDNKELEEADFKERIDCARSLYNFINSKIEDFRKEVGPKLKEMIETIVKDYFYKEDGESFKVNYNEDTWDISFDIEYEMNQNGGEKKIVSMSPRRFLNTFRFKLFTFSLKLALGLCMKLLNKVDFPYIIDDMFDSSDFDNRKEIGEFFRQVIESHDKIIEAEAKKINNSPEYKEKDKASLVSQIRKLKNPQIIFFTQDEVIAQSLYSYLSSVQPIVFGRLFHISEIDKNEDKRTLQERDGFEGIDYANLYDVVQKSF